MPTSRKTKEAVDLYLKLPRFLKSDYHRGDLTLDELWVLVWLWWDANPYNGLVKVSYPGLASDFRNTYSKNHINKIVLALKRKQYLIFPRQQGRRGSFEVKLHRYPLTNGRYTNITTQGAKTRRSKSEPEQKADRGRATEIGRAQKLKSERDALAERLSLNNTKRAWQKHQD